MYISSLLFLRKGRKRRPFGFIGSAFLQKKNPPDSGSGYGKKACPVAVRGEKSSKKDGRFNDFILVRHKGILI
jgi:hypothetical protein